jgi:anti-sigma factor RsiW
MDRRGLVLAAAVFIGGAVGASAAGLPAGWKARGATTSMRAQRLPRRRPPAQDLLDLPVNLGFEEE